MEGTVFKLIFAQTYPFRPGIAAIIEDAVKAAVGLSLVTGPARERFENETRRCFLLLVYIEVFAFNNMFYAS
jgi:hypothetical protein